MGYFEQLLAREPPEKLYHYTSVGGVAGIILGILASKILSALANWPTLISPTSVVSSG